MRQRRRFFAALGVVLLTMLVAPPAWALPSARLIFLRGPETESCPSESEVREAVLVRLGYDPFNSYAPSSMVVEIATEKGGYVARLKLVDQDSVVHGDRELHSAKECRELMNAMALTISLAIDPMSVSPNGPPEDAPPAERPVASLPTISTPVSDAPAPPAAEGPPKVEALALTVAIAPLASVGSAPGVAGGGALTIDAQRGVLFGGIEGRLDAPASRAVDLGRVRSSFLSGSLYAGLRRGPFFAAAVGSLGRIAATSSDVAIARDQDALYAGVGVLVGAGIRITERLELRPRLEVLANLIRHRLEISQQTAYRYPVASGNLALGLAYRFW